MTLATDDAKRLITCHYISLSYYLMVPTFIEIEAGSSTLYTRPEARPLASCILPVIGMTSSTLFLKQTDGRSPQDELSINTVVSGTLATSA
jgi:hypothetical protein